MPQSCLQLVLFRTPCAWAEGLRGMRLFETLRPPPLTPPICATCAMLFCGCQRQRERNLVLSDNLPPYIAYDRDFFRGSVLTAWYPTSATNVRESAAPLMRRADSCRNAGLLPVRTQSASSFEVLKVMNAGCAFPTYEVHWPVREIDVPTPGTRTFYVTETRALGCSAFLPP